MPVEIPLTSAGERIVSVNTGSDVFFFRSYYVQGQDRHWLLDVLDGQERPLMAGINLTSGADNLLKGLGDVLDGYELHVVVHDGKSEKSLEAPGRDMGLLWFGPGEDNPFAPFDPMETIGTEESEWSLPAE